MQLVLFGPDEGCSLYQQVNILSKFFGKDMTWVYMGIFLFPLEINNSIEAVLCLALYKREVRLLGCQRV